MDMLKFSVSMCTYGGDNPEWLTTAIESILNQTVKPDEVVLVVDGPVPNGVDTVIRRYEENPLFKVIRLEKNVGHGEARRTGLKNCSFPLVALMDSDDISHPDRFAEQLSLFKADPSLDIVGADITEFIGESENTVGMRQVPCEDADIKEYLKTRCPMNQVTVMFKRDSVESVGGYIDWFCEEDYYLWLRMFMAGMKFANIQKTLVNVRVGKDMYNRRGGLKYFKSEARLQKFMLDNRIIGLPTYLINVAKRLIVQVLLPNRIRGWVFKKFARRSV